MLHDRCTKACRSRDGRRPQASPSCLILLRQSLGLLSASGLTNCRQNRLAACHPCQAGDEISVENAATDPRNRVAARIAHQRKKSWLISTNVQLSTLKPSTKSSQLSTVRGCRMNSMVVPSGSWTYTTRFPAFGPD